MWKIFHTVQGQKKTMCMQLLLSCWQWKRCKLFVKTTGELLTIPNGWSLESCTGTSIMSRTLMISSPIYLLYCFIIVRRLLLPFFPTNCTSVKGHFIVLLKGFFKNLLMLFVFGLGILNDAYHVWGSDSLLSYSIRWLWQEVLKTQKKPTSSLPGRVSL